MRTAPPRAGPPASPGPVLHVSTARTWRGGEQQLVYLVEALREAGVAQVVLCAAGSKLEEACRARGLPHEARARRASIDPLFVWAVARAARGAGAALVHAHDPHAHAAAVLAATCLGLRAPVVVHRRVDFPVGGGPVSRWKYEHRAVRRVVCVSAAIAEIVGRALRDPSRIEVVHDGIDPARFAGPADGRLRRALGAPPSAPLVGTVAALVGHKDPLTFVDAAARLLAAGTDARFVLVGDGPLRPAVEAAAQARGLAGRLVVTGFRDDVPALLPELDVFLFTSAQEGLGSSILDAWACRVPVVATAAGGIPELVTDGETGLLAPIRDGAALAGQVRRVLADAALRARLVEGASRRLGAFGTGPMARRILEIYRRVAGEAAP